MSSWKFVYMRVIAAVVIITFGGMITSPAAAAMQETYETPPAPDAVVEDETARLAASVVEAREELRKLAGRPDPENRVASLEERRAARERLKTLRAELRELDTRTRAEFARVGELVASRNLPPVIAERHAAAMAEYDARASALLGDLETIETSDEPTAFERADTAFERLESIELERGHQPFDPENLPNRALQPVEGNEPKLNAEDFITRAETLDYTHALAANDDFDLSGLIGADESAYLASTTEVVLSDAINAKAAELNHDPVEIYNWVRNNVQWQPYWGAVQNADLTLSAQRGTAMDIASLTIALLRTSGIPARYVHGTIELPEEQFRNWVGGFEYINAAIEFASSGGIPIVGVTSGGEVTKVRMQHIWVEAAVDFAPSRGAINRAADSWVPLDPSFKQYEFVNGLDPAEISGAQYEDSAETFIATGDRSEDGAWLTGLEPAVLQNIQDITILALDNHVTENLAEITVGDVLGGRDVVQHSNSELAGTLAVDVLVIGSVYASLPDTLRQKMVFDLRGDGPSNAVSVRIPWAELNNQRVTLKFKPATSADEQALLAFLPQGASTELTQLPDGIPAYLIRVIPTIALNDDEILSAEPQYIGSEITYTTRIEMPGRVGSPNPYRVTAGSYLSLGVIAGNVGPVAIQASQSNLYELGQVLASSSPTGIGLSADEYLSHLFHGGLLSYYNQYTRITDLMSDLDNRGHHYLSGGVGSIGYEPDVHTVLGLPMAIRHGGVVMNIPILSTFGYDTTSDIQGREARVDFIMHVGMVSSALEHKIPEDMFAAGYSAVDGISAVKAISKANSEGQRIYHLNQTNWTDHIESVNQNPLVMDEVRRALNNGMEVIIHASPLVTPGWIGAGYIIFDPSTGDAAYKIGGGQNGIFLFIGLVLIGLMMWMVAVATIALAAGSGPFAPVVLAYGAVLEYQLMLQAFRFAERIRDISSSNCDAETKVQLAKDTLFMIFVQTLVTRLAGSVKSTGLPSSLRTFLEEALRLVGVTGGLGVLDQFRVARTDQVLDRCRN